MKRTFIAPVIGAFILAAATPAFAQRGRPDNRGSRRLYDIRGSPTTTGSAKASKKVKRRPQPRPFRIPGRGRLPQGGVRLQPKPG